MKICCNQYIRYQRNSERADHTQNNAGAPTVGMYISQLRRSALMALHTQWHSILKQAQIDQIGVTHSSILSEWPLLKTSKYLDVIEQSRSIAVLYARLAFHADWLAQKAVHLAHT